MYEKCLKCKNKKQGCHDRCPYYISIALVKIEMKESEKKQKSLREWNIKSVERAKKHK